MGNRRLVRLPAPLARGRCGHTRRPLPTGVARSPSGAALARPWSCVCEKTVPVRWWPDGSSWVGPPRRSGWGRSSDACRPVTTAPAGISGGSGNGAGAGGEPPTAPALGVARPEGGEVCTVDGPLAPKPPARQHAAFQPAPHRRGIHAYPPGHVLDGVPHDAGIVTYTWQYARQRVNLVY